MGFSIRSLLLGSSLLVSACASDEGGTDRSYDEPLSSIAGSDDEWVLVFGDEFDSNALDTSIWSALSGDLVHSSTLNSASPSMASVADGSLFVSAVPTPEDKAFPYTAGYLETRGRFAQTYGKIEFRVRCKYAPGLWYAVWGRPWQSAVPEIDIEFLAENVTEVWFVNHWDLPPVPAADRREFTTVGGLDITDFHTYSVTWKTDLVEWQIDGKPYMRITGRGVPHEPVFWVMNAWVGGWAGTPGKGTVFPADFEIDYFRVYRMRDWPVEPSIRVVRAKETYGAADTIDVELADFERSARVEVWEGPKLVGTMTTPPFKFEAKNLARGAHELTLVGTDGTRKASMTIAPNVR
ncbi:MAG TPA: glycoside hydrolase family 16 protein [Labilithrix sp.]|jgi:beta-glucanase (GH16 family)|nr:glycoside hydrolase family 16 protein [Labilithrix sp.]